MINDEIKQRIHQHLIRKTDFIKVKDNLGEDELRAFVDKAINSLIEEEQLELLTEDRLALIRELVSAVVSLGPLRPLIEDPDITEIMVNGPDRIYVQKKGQITLSNVRFPSTDNLNHTIQKILAASGTNKRVDESNPYVDFPLAGGSRVNVLLPPCSLVGPLVTIRKFAAINTVDDLIELKTLDKEIAVLLTAAMKAKLNIIFAGATGTGKTTTLNVFSRHIPEHERIITIEDTPELRLMQEHVVPLQSKSANVEGKGAISIRDLFINALRMRPDRIIVGEVRSHEMLDLIESIASGHSGSLAIVHAESPEDCFSRMVTMMLMTGIRLETKVIMKQIAKAIDLIVHSILYPDGVRRIAFVTDVKWDEDKDDVAFNHIFFFDQDDMGEDNKITGKWVRDRTKPSFLKKFKNFNVKVPDNYFNKE